MASRPTYSAGAEKALLGACLLSYGPREILAHDLVPEDFYVVAHQRIAEAIIDLHSASSAVDALIVAGWLSDRHGAEGLAACGGIVALTEMIADVPGTSGARTYADRILDRSARRKARAVLEAGLARVDDLGEPIGATADDTIERLRSIDLPGDTEGEPLDIGEFMAQKAEYRWLIPHVIERTDRLIITASDGRGKSTLLRQLAVQIAAGIHPWALLEYEPARSLLLDVENSVPQIQRALSRLYAAVRPLGQGALGERQATPFDVRNVRIEARPQGIDLLSRRDRQWFTSRVRAARPDIILTGPLYKLHRGNPNDEEPAATLAAYFDDLRARFDCALVFEAHPPHGNDGGSQRTLRPYGAALWMRWPEFGFGLRVAKDGGWDWVPWRGARDEARWWPEKLTRGQKWPWEPMHWISDEEPF